MLKNLLVANLFLVSVMSVFAQTPPQKTVQDDDDVIRISSRLVMVPVSVTDASGMPVKGLKASDFLIFEENTAQEVAELLPAEQVPLEIAILIDVSASTGPMFEFQQAAAAKFLEEVMRPGDRAVVFSIGSKPVLVQGRESVEFVGPVVKSIQATREQTAFYDAVVVAARYLAGNSPKNSRRVVLAITDGDDTSSTAVVRAIIEAESKLLRGGMGRDEIREIRVKARDEAKTAEQSRVLRELQNADAVFFSINPGGGSTGLPPSAVFGQSNLDRFAQETGGSAYVPRFQPTTLRDPILNDYNNRANLEMLSGIFRGLANELRAQYVVEYYSDTEYKAGRFVPLRVILNSQNAFKVRARNGYFVSSEQ
jgi:Ca-activated chloride channel family protein